MRTSIQASYRAACSSALAWLALWRPMPIFLLMDEAFSALDPLIRSQMQDQLVELQDPFHKTIVFITHDLDEALKIGDKIAILKDGVLSQVGTPADILMHPADDYVAQFVRDVNRARVLTVDVVAKPPKLRLTNENLENALASMRTLGTDVGYVVEDGGNYVGYVTETGWKRRSPRRARRA
jgi:glycine betaine/proline transport system ATP-binding protein